LLQLFVRIDLQAACAVEWIRGQLLMNTPVTFGKLQLDGPFMASAVFEGAAGEDGLPTKPLLMKRYADLARGGVDLISTSHVCVHPSGLAGPGQLRLDSDDTVPAWAEFVAAVKAVRPTVKLIAQLAHAGRYADRNRVATEDIVVPSTAVGEWSQALKADDPTMNPLFKDADEATLAAIPEWFAAAAVRAQKAGLDGVHLHAGHGYLLLQFLTPALNRRTDWAADGAAFVAQVVAAIRTAVGPDFSVTAKINCQDNLPAEVGGLGPDDYAKIYKTLIAAGLDALELSHGTMTSRPGAIVPLKMLSAPCTNLAAALTIREWLNANGCPDFPLAVVSGIRSSADVEQVLAAGIEVVSFGRPLVRQPNLPTLFRADPDAKAACQSCFGCLICSMKGKGEADFGCVVARKEAEKAAAAAAVAAAKKDMEDSA
jgi:2,4-dienoyl-CoA reductase-like NADH-dependent reductase (Old Yellow Enzyme family)